MGFARTKESFKAGRQRWVCAASSPRFDGLAVTVLSPHACNQCCNQPDRNLEARELGHAIEAAIASLPLIYREPVLFRFTAGLAVDEIAEALGTSAPVVKTRLFRARQLLQEALGKEWLAR